MDEVPDSHETNDAEVPSELETPANQLIGPYPATFMMRHGTLRLADDRLSFTRDRGKVIFDAPAHEFHDFQLGRVKESFKLWHGDTKYVIYMDPGFQVSAAFTLGGAAVGIAKGVSMHHRQRAAAELWTRVLDGRVGPSTSKG